MVHYLFWQLQPKPAFFFRAWLIDQLQCDYANQIGASGYLEMPGSDNQDVAAVGIRQLSDHGNGELDTCIIGRFSLVENRYYTTVHRQFA